MESKDNSGKEHMGSNEPKLRQTIVKDFREGNVRTRIKSELAEIQKYYLTAERLKRLESMCWLRRWFYRLFWISRELVLKLSPIRRILLVLSLISMISIQTEMAGGSVSFRTNNYLGYFLILIILALELKDKLIAKDELEFGRKVQKSLLPATNPMIEGWDIVLYTESANDVGGDLVDYIEFGKGSIALTIGDVSGKGLGAALLMAKLQATIKAFARTLGDLKTILENLNIVFCEDVPANNFASLIYMTLNSADGRVQLINAGHMPPLFYHQQKLIEMEHGNPALGMVKQIEFDDQSIDMDVNDMLFLYSDGLSEAKNAEQELFGEERVRKLISQYVVYDVNTMASKILEAVNQYMGDEHRTDDLSFIIIKRIH
ncbi:serine/threonine-protein phosphatase [candidate division KSB1 bacterium]|nr:serine/threonine-protein phosphatase [candidate division KSB1 bacterium]